MSFSEKTQKTNINAFYKYRLPYQYEAKIQEMFDKCFLYNKCDTPGKVWSLPPADELFTEYYKLEILQEFKTKLNHVKSKLNNYDIEEWSKHTRHQDPAGQILYRLKNQTDAEFVTIGWCKMYECLSKFPELVIGPKMNSLHLCEVPGAFVAALNHYLYTNYNQNEVEWHWLATTYNPYYEGNNIKNMITDDRFLFYTLDNWLFLKDFTGNIIDAENQQYLKEQCEKRLGKVHLITADGSTECIESPGDQEDTVSVINYAEIITALTILADGGSFLIKVFTMFEASSVGKLFLLNCVFEKVHVFKPYTSKRGSSELYLVCINYKKDSKHLQEIIEKMKMKLIVENLMLWPLFTKSSLPIEFLRQHQDCCQIFMEYQIDAIEQNINAYKFRQNKFNTNRLQNLKMRTCAEFYERYKIKKLPNELKILHKCQGEIERGIKHRIHTGSYTERKMIMYTSIEERIFMLRQHIHKLENMLEKEKQELKYEFEFNENEEEVKLHLYRGRTVTTLGSSLFAKIQIFVIHTELNDIYRTSCDSLWSLQPRAVCNYDSPMPIVINYNEFCCSTGNFAVQQENFFKFLISTLIEVQPNKVKFVNMPFLTHYAVSILRYLFGLTYSNLSFSFEPEYEIVLCSCTPNFINNLKDLEEALSSSLNQDILCVTNISLLHRNSFKAALHNFNNMLLLEIYKKLLCTQ